MVFFQRYLWVCDADIILNIGFTPVLWVLIWVKVFKHFQGLICFQRLHMVIYGFLIWGFEKGFSEGQSDTIFTLNII